MDIRPAVGAALAPLLALLVGAACFTLVLLSARGANYPLWLVAPALLAAMVLLPLAGMGFVYSIVGASVVIDATKQSATWQQGLLGLGVGTRELVPFAKIALFEVVEVARAGGATQLHIDCRYPSPPIPRRAPPRSRSSESSIPPVPGNRNSPG